MEHLGMMRHSIHESHRYPGIRAQAGVTLLEALIAITIFAIGGLASVSVSVMASSTDESTRESNDALRVASAAMEEVLAYDYQDDVQGFIDHWSNADNANFVVADLGSESVGLLAGESEISASSSAAALGAIAVDASDPERIGVSVTIIWRGRKGARALVLTTTITELTP